MTTVIKLDGTDEIFFKCPVCNDWTGSRMHCGDDATLHADNLSIKCEVCQQRVVVSIGWPPEERGSCPDCGQVMTDSATTSCLVLSYYLANPDGTGEPTFFARIPYYDEGGPERCHDCKVAFGGMHHPGCDAERCPACGGQLIGCNCWGDDEEDAA